MAGYSQGLGCGVRACTGALLPLTVPVTAPRRRCRRPGDRQEAPVQAAWIVGGCVGLRCRTPRPGTHSQGQGDLRGRRARPGLLLGGLVLIGGRSRHRRRSALAVWHSKGHVARPIKQATSGAVDAGWVRRKNPDHHLVQVRGTSPSRRGGLSAYVERLVQDFVCAPRWSAASRRLQNRRWLSLNRPSDLARAGGQVGWQLCKSRSGNRLSALSRGRGDM
jgi:hypothetical protein